MRVLGVDPGLACTGWGVVECRGAEERCLGWGALKTAAGQPPEERMDVLYRGIGDVIAHHAPEVVALEQLIHSPRASSAFQVGHARGVVLLAAAQHGMKVYEYGPPAVKQAVVGYGRAEKAQVAQMVRVLLGLSEVPRPADATDALAVAICHLHSLDRPGEAP